MSVATLDSLVEDGHRALETGHFAQARALFVQAVELEPRPELCQLAAVASFEGGELELARGWLKRAVDIDPEFLPAYEGLAKIHFEWGHLRKSLDYLDEIIVRQPDEVGALSSAALIHLELRESGPGLRLAQKLLSLQPDNPDFLLIAGRLHRLSGANKLAADMLRRAVVLQPEGHEARVELGWCELALGRLPEARLCFETALNQAPRHVDAWRGLAKVLLRTKLYDQAVPAIRKVTELEPADIGAVLDLAEAYMESGHRDSAMALIADLLKRAPDAPGVAARAGKYHFRTRDFERAEYLLQKAMVADPADAESLETLGCTYLAQRDHLPALNCFRRVWRMRPLSPRALVNILSTYAVWGWDVLRSGRMPPIKIGRFEIGGRARSARYLDLGHEAFRASEFRKAAMYYRKIRDTDPNFEVACAWLANAQLKQGKTDAAIETCQRGLARAPASAPLLALLGTLAMSQDKMTHAVRILKKSIELDPDLGDAWLTLGRAYQKEGELEDAMVAFQRASDLNVSDPYLYRHMGDTALALGDKSSALESYRRALEINPRDLVTCQRLIECNFGARQYDDAIQIARHAISVDPNAYAAYAWLGRIYRQLQSYTAAKDAFEQAIAIRPSLGFLHRQLGGLLEQMKLEYEAMEAYQAALRIDPDDWEADRGLARVKRLAGKR